jgi:hypothetical protein
MTDMTTKPVTTSDKSPWPELIYNIVALLFWLWVVSVGVGVVKDCLV